MWFICTHLLLFSLPYYIALAIKKMKKISAKVSFIHVDLLKLAIVDFSFRTGQ